MAWDSKASGWDWDNEVLFQGQGTDFRKRLPANEWTSDSSELVLTGGGSGGPQNLCSNAPSGLGPSVVAATSSIGSEPSGLPGVVVANGIGAHTSNFSRVDHTSSRRLAMEDRSHSLGDVGGGGGGPFDCFGKDEANTNGSSRRTEKRAHDNAAAEERNVSFLELRSHASSRRVAEHVPADHHSNKGDCSLVSLGQEPGLQRSSLAAVSSSEQHKRPPPPFLSVGGVDASQDVKKESTKGSTEEQQHSSTGATGSGGSGDSLNCLKLGKRTYFEDTTTTGSGGSKTAAAAAAATTTSSAATPAVTNSLPAAKKARAAAPGLQTPRCQVEGCKADLTSCKEYHRRHKVCEMHSKTARVIVAGQEQRFCQQCSRFHVLSEFDEGKRSCRRRLAGHNERRRKPQPDPLALNPRLPPNFQDDRRLGLFWAERSPFLHHSRMSGIPSVWEDSDDFRFPHGKGAWPRMVKLEDQSAYDCPMQGQGIERQLFLTGLSQQNNDRLPLLLLQSPKGMIPTANDVAGQRFHHYLQGSVGPIGQALSLSSSSGAGVLSGLEATPATEGLTRVSDSGRALSLLSSQPWCSRAPVAASLDLSTRSNMTLDQLINENQTPIAQPLLQGGQHQHFDFTTEKLLFMAPHSQSVLTSSGLPAGPMEKEPHVGSFIHGFSGFGHFDSHPMLCMQGHAQEGNSQDVKPTIDLMRMVSSSQSLSIQPHGPSEAFQIGSSHFGELQALRSYESSIFDSQHMM